MSSPLVGLPIRAPAQPSTPPDDDAIYALVRDLFREQVNPAVAKHGGQAIAESRAAPAAVLT